VCTFECEKLPKVSCPIPRSEKYSRCRVEFSATHTSSETTLQYHHLQPRSCHRTNLSCSNSCILRLHGTSTLTDLKHITMSIHKQDTLPCMYKRSSINKSRLNLNFSCMPHCAKNVQTTAKPTTSQCYTTVCKDKLNFGQHHGQTTCQAFDTRG